MQLSIFLIDLFVGTYRLSSHARLEAFVIQTKLYVGDCLRCLVTPSLSINVGSGFLAKPQSWGAAPRFGGFPPKLTPGRAGPPSAPPAPRTCKAP